jgi:hypothetical protein
MRIVDVGERMTKRQTLLLVLLAGCTEGFGPSNIDLGLHVEAQVLFPAVSLSDSTALLKIRVLVANSSDHDIIVETGGPPFHITGDPTESGGLSTSIRIANEKDPLNAGPGIDSWGGSRDTFPAGRAQAHGYTIRVHDWKARCVSGAGLLQRPGRHVSQLYTQTLAGELVAAALPNQRMQPTSATEVEFR